MIVSYVRGKCRYRERRRRRKRRGEVEEWMMVGERNISTIRKRWNKDTHKNK